jgi:hypothetical protein
MDRLLHLLAAAALTPGPLSAHASTPATFRTCHLPRLRRTQVSRTQSPRTPAVAATIHERNLTQSPPPTPT